VYSPRCKCCKRNAGHENTDNVVTEISAEPINIDVKAKYVNGEFTVKLQTLSGEWYTFHTEPTSALDHVIADTRERDNEMQHIIAQDLTYSGS